MIPSDAGESSALTLYLFVRGDTPVRGLIRGTPADVSALKFDGKALKGKVTPKYKIEASFEFSLDLDCSVDGEKVAGSFIINVPENAQNAQQVKGAVTGQHLDAKAFAELGKIKEGLAWPRWSGPNQDFSATDTGVKLVSSLSEARLLWASEVFLPGMLGGIDRKQGAVKKGWRAEVSGGAMSPLVADGKVFVMAFVPVGPPYADKIEGREVIDQIEKLGGPESAAHERSRFGIYADDTAYCFEAATGQLLWKTTIPGGANWQHHKLGPSNMSPVYADGKFFGLGSTGRVFAFDAKTGEMLWQNNIGGRHKELVQMRDEAAANKVMFGKGDRQHGVALTATRRLVISSDYGGGTLIAFNQADGKRVWQSARVEVGREGECTPVIWTHQDKEYLFTRDAKALSCLDVETGKTLWAIPLEEGVEGSLVKPLKPDPGIEDNKGNKGGARTCTLTGDRLLLKVHNRNAVRKENYVAAGQTKGYTGEEEVVCLQLSPAGAKELWRIPVPGAGGYLVQAVYDGKVLVRGGDEAVMYSLENGKELARNKTLGGGVNEQFIFGGEGHLYIRPDNKHGHSQVAMVSADPATFSAEGAGPSGFWTPPHPNDTGYGPAVACPIVDGRMFMRGRDGVYCYDLRK